MTSLLLDTNTWDLCLDASGNIALASDPYATVQDVACALKLSQGELWYDKTKGVPYFASVLGQDPQLQLLKSYFLTAANSVPSVVNAACFITNIQNRAVEGQVQVTTQSGVTLGVSI